MAGTQTLHQGLGNASSISELTYSNGNPGKLHLLWLYLKDSTLWDFQIRDICPLLHLFSSFYENASLKCQKIILSTSSYKTRKPRLSKIKNCLKIIKLPHVHDFLGRKSETDSAFWWWFRMKSLCRSNFALCLHVLKEVMVPLLLVMGALVSGRLLVSDLPWAETMLEWGWVGGEVLIGSPVSHVFLVLGICDIYLAVQVGGFGLGYFCLFWGYWLCSTFSKPVNK